MNEVEERDSAAHGCHQQFRQLTSVKNALNSNKNNDGICYKCSSNGTENSCIKMTGTAQAIGGRGTLVEEVEEHDMVCGPVTGEQWLMNDFALTDNEERLVGQENERKVFDVSADGGAQCNNSSGQMADDRKRRGARIQLIETGLEDSTDDDDDHVCVCDNDSSDRTVLELPLNKDGNLPISTLSHSFPEAIGLKYMNASSGLYRTLAVDEDNKCVLPPKCGWSKRRFVAIFSNGAPTDRRRPGSSETAECLGVEDDGQSDRLRVPVDLFVRNLSFKTTDETLKNYFEAYGGVQYVEVKKDYRSGLPRGYGFIKMKTIEDQDKVLKEGEFYIDCRMAQVCDTRSDKLHKNVIYPEDDNERITTKLYVGRVYDDLTEDDLLNTFDAEAKKLSPLAKVERVFIPKPNRGFAYVSLNDPKVVNRLCKMRDFLCAGKSVFVSLPRPKAREHVMHSNVNRLSYRQHPYGRYNDEMYGSHSRPNANGGGGGGYGSSYNSYASQFTSSWR